MTTPVTNTLAMCLDAPMQSWGLRARFITRDTAQEPTKSGVVGLLAAALGIPQDRDDRIQELAELRMGIRVDREGLVERDYHTTANVPNTEGTGHRTVVSQRYYLADALFLVVLESTNPDQLLQLHQALQHPHWPIYLGRKAFVPTRSLVNRIPDDPYLGINAGTFEDTITNHPWLENRTDLRHKARTSLRQGEDHHLRTMTDTTPADPHAEPRRDSPVSFRQSDRRFRTRSVRTGHTALTEDLISAGEQSCI